jgi:hypothetical protein
LEEELGALGPASPSQLEEVSRLINSSRRISLQLAEEKEMAVTLRDKFSALVKGLAQTAHVQALLGKTLDSCEEKETQTSGAVEQALQDCTVRIQNITIYTEYTQNKINSFERPKKILKKSHFKIYLRCSVD